MTYAFILWEDFSPPLPPPGIRYICSFLQRLDSKVTGRHTHTRTGERHVDIDYISLQGQHMGLLCARVLLCHFSLLASRHEAQPLIVKAVMIVNCAKQANYRSFFCLLPQQTAKMAGPGNPAQTCCYPPLLRCLLLYLSFTLKSVLELKESIESTFTTIYVSWASVLSSEAGEITTDFLSNSYN